MIFCGMLDLCKIIFGIVVDLFRPRAALEAEILVLRQQIIVLRRGRPSRVPFLAVDRMVLGWVCQLFPKTSFPMSCAACILLVLKVVNFEQTRMPDRFRF